MGTIQNTTMSQLDSKPIAYNSIVCYLYDFISKYLDISFPVFYARLKAGLQPAVQCCRVANPPRAMLENFWSSTYAIEKAANIKAAPVLLKIRDVEKKCRNLYTNSDLQPQ